QLADEIIDVKLDVLVDLIHDLASLLGDRNVGHSLITLVSPARDEILFDQDADETGGESGSDIKTTRDLIDLKLRRRASVNLDQRLVGERIEPELLRLFLHDPKHLAHDIPRFGHADEIGVLVLRAPRLSDRRSF